MLRESCWSISCRRHNSQQLGKAVAVKYIYKKKKLEDRRMLPLVTSVSSTNPLKNVSFPVSFWLKFGTEKKVVYSFHIILLIKTARWILFFPSSSFMMTVVAVWVFDLKCSYPLLRMMRADDRIFINRKSPRYYARAPLLKTFERERESSHEGNKETKKKVHHKFINQSGVWNRGKNQTTTTTTHFSDDADKPSSPKSRKLLIVAFVWYKKINRLFFF